MYLIVKNSGFVRVGGRRGGWWVPTVSQYLNIWLPLFCVYNKNIFLKT